MKKVQLIKAAMKFKNSPRLSVIRALSVKDCIFVNKNPKFTSSVWRHGLYPPKHSKMMLCRFSRDVR